MSKVWFVTGASSGIGAEVVKAALGAGHLVVATARKVEKLRARLKEQDSEKLALVPLDVTREEQAATAVQAALESFGRIDVLVNNAGYSVLGNFEEITDEQLQREFATNFFGVTSVLRAVLPVMRRQGSGHIFNVSSTAGVIGFKQAGVYGATKFAVEGLSLALAQEVEPLGIKVTLVEPGNFRTELLAPESVVWGELSIEDYGAPGDVQAAYQRYHHQQPGDPAKLGRALVEIAAMETPPRQFLAGSDALATVVPALEARLAEIRQYTALSQKTDGDFQAQPAEQRSENTRSTHAEQPHNRA